mmetsp:Transcript_61647/g.147094  ORF Transcript_61647/g.147094 Transcript_61647/m.147094 type:complete len:144 (+) Transcript_61647:1073-1504(+)
MSRSVTAREDTWFGTTSDQATCCVACPAAVAFHSVHLLAAGAAHLAAPRALALAVASLNRKVLRSSCTSSSCPSFWELMDTKVLVKCPRKCRRCLEVAKALLTTALACFPRSICMLSAYTYAPDLYVAAYKQAASASADGYVI